MANEVSIEVLEETPQKVLPFLKAIATKVEIRAAMARCGYGEEEQKHGWQLLLAASGFDAQDASFPASDDDNARNAIAELDAWDESGFRRIHAALGRLHPEQDAFVFAGIEPGKGTGSIVSVAMLLDRLDALESSPDRTATRDADAAALATLAKRGIDSAVRKQLRETVGFAQSAKTPIVSTPTSPTEREKKLAELHAWFGDWSETARAIVRRRDHLILMGFAKRKGSKKEETPSTEPVVEPAPIPTTAPNTNVTVGNGSPVSTTNP